MGESFQDYVSSPDGQWTIKGFVDIFKKVYTLSDDTKVISKILETHLLPKVIEFADKSGYKVVLASHQNYYPDITFVKKSNEKIKFALDFKTTYRNAKKPRLCNGFTLGSHGGYFIKRTGTKNIEFPYGAYAGHFCLGIIYDRVETSAINEARAVEWSRLKQISSVAKNFQFFVSEKWKIAGDKRGSGNTANIGSIVHIEDMVHGRGMFSKLGEAWFDDYWMNYGKIKTTDRNRLTMTISSLKDFVEYRGGDVRLIVPKRTK